MKKRNLGAMAAAFAVSALAFNAVAVPARPGIFKIKQADGTELPVQLRGDERAHFYLTEDGYLLLEKEGLFYYGNTDAKGEIISSGIRAVAASSRNDAARKYLEKVDTPAVLGALQKRDQKRAASNVDRGYGLDPEASFPCFGKQKALIILVDYPDVPFTLEDPYAYFSEMLGGDDFTEYNATGSARQYYLDSSNGQFDIEFDVYGPVTMPHDMAFYGGNIMGNDRNPAQMVVDACDLLDDEIDFSEYDRDDNGAIDNVYIFYAGKGEASGGSADTIWPHSWDVTAAGVDGSYDGKRLGHYACSNEWFDGGPDGIGTFCHEFAHVLGLPDLYATSYTSAFTPGSWELLDQGSYNNNSRTPPLMSTFSRYALGWLQPTVIERRAEDYELKPLVENEAYLIPTANPTEYFLLENRQRKGWDSYIPGHGMLVWHIDYDPDVWYRNQVNNSPKHQYVDIEEADGTQSETTRRGDAFPGSSGKKEFTDETNPSMKTWKKIALKTPVTDITETPDGLITFSVCKLSVGVPVPEVNEATELTSVSFRANWEKADGVKKYRFYLNKLVDGGQKSVVINGLELGNVDFYNVTDLQPETTYSYCVSSVVDGEESALSEEIKVTTGKPGFDTLRPKDVVASDVTDESFLLTWAPMELAKDYVLDVYTKENLGPREDVCGFDEGVNQLPQGWETNSTMAFFNSSFSGESAPSIFLKDTGDYVLTPDYGSKIHFVSFWLRGQSTGADDLMAVKCKTPSGWQTIANVEVPTGKSVIAKVEDIPADAIAFRLEFVNNAQTGRVAVDDVTVGYDEVIASVAAGGYEAYKTGDVHSLIVENLVPETDYYYTLRGFDGTMCSLPSPEGKLRTLEKAGINSITAAPEWLTVNGMEITVTLPGTVTLSDLSGRIIYRGESQRISVPATGVYMLTVGSQSAKIMVK